MIKKEDRKEKKSNEVSEQSTAGKNRKDGWRDTAAKGGREGTAVLLLNRNPLKSYLRLA